MNHFSLRPYMNLQLSNEDGYCVGVGEFQFPRQQNMIGNSEKRWIKLEMLPLIPTTVWKQIPAQLV